jgi:hypothetical protein
MDYEKKYKEALERARKLKENPQSVFNEYSPKEGDTISDYIFPELKKESEDERIRKVLVELVKCNERSGYTLLNNVSTSSMLAWLEKQGEKKPSWSEEDEEMCQETIDWFEKKCFPYALENDNPARESIKWLKSLKNKVQPQNTWKPSDEQMEALFVLLPTVCNSNPAFSLYNDLKKLKG